MKKWVHVSLVMVFGFPVTSMAQDATELPSGPLLTAHAPDFSQWTATTKPNVVKPAPAGPGAAASLLSDFASPTELSDKGTTEPRIENVVKTGKVRHVTLTESNGLRKDIWCMGDLQVIQSPTWKVPIFSAAGNRTDAARIDFSKSDFPGFEWISPNNYKGTRKVAGHDCLIFEGDVLLYNAAPGDSTEGVPVVVDIAAVDKTTHLPILLQHGADLTTYVFGPPPTEALTLPSDLEQQLDNLIRKQEAFLRPPAKP